MKKAIVKIFAFIIYLVNFFMPKNKNKMCIHAFPDFESSTRAILNYAQGKSLTLVIVKQKTSKVPEWAKKQNVIIINKYSLSNFYHYLTSYIVIHTHGFFSRTKIPPSQVNINIWHGMPIKKIGHYLTADNQDIPYSTYLLATSPFFSAIMEKAFKNHYQEILISEAPYYHFLDDNAAKKKNLTIVCLPTYRNSTTGYITNDGNLISPYINIYNLDLHELNTWLEKANIKMIIKPHPMAQPICNSSNLSNIIVIDEKWLGENNTTLYELLNTSDGLITDISSVAVDYLFTNKPIIFAIGDLEEYIKSRGLIFDDFFNPDSMPGPVVQNTKELITTIDDIFLQNKDNYKNKRLALREKFIHAPSFYEHLDKLTKRQ